MSAKGGELEVKCASQRRDSHNLARIDYPWLPWGLLVLMLAARRPQFLQAMKLKALFPMLPLYLAIPLG
jgi:hypothetical protein